jgi:hypothetical protein
MRNDLAQAAAAGFLFLKLFSLLGACLLRFLEDSN